MVPGFRNFFNQLTSWVWWASFSPLAHGLASHALHLIMTSVCAEQGCEQLFKDTTLSHRPYRRTGLSTTDYCRQAPTLSAAAAAGRRQLSAGQFGRTFCRGCDCCEIQPEWLFANDPREYRYVLGNEVYAQKLLKKRHSVSVGSNVRSKFMQKEYELVPVPQSHD